MPASASASYACRSKPERDTKLLRAIVAASLFAIRERAPRFHPHRRRILKSGCPAAKRAARCPRPHSEVFHHERNRRYSDKSASRQKTGSATFRLERSTPAPILSHTKSP